MPLVHLCNNAMNEPELFTLAKIKGTFIIFIYLSYVAHHWTQQIIFYKTVSGSSTENYLIIFPSITFKILLLRGLAATLSPIQIQMCVRRWQANSWRFLYPQPTSTENHLSGCGLLEKIHANTLAPGQSFSHPHRSPRNDTWVLQYTKDSSDWKNLQLMWSGILLRSCFGAPPFGAGVSEIWIWILTLASSNDLTSRVVCINHYLI